MIDSYIEIQKSSPLAGTVSICGAKNAVLVTMASLVLTDGVSQLTNVPASADVLHMIALLEDLGALIQFNTREHHLIVDTRTINKWRVSPALIKKMRASVLVAGALLARFGRADIAVPGGCGIGARPLDYHVKCFNRLGVEVHMEDEFLCMKSTGPMLQGNRVVLEYPSVGATENCILAATNARGTTRIINAALEPEVMDLIIALRRMGASINVEAPATIVIEGCKPLYPIVHPIMADRLEAGSILLAAAITGGSVTIPEARQDTLDVFLLKLQEMGHTIITGEDGLGIQLIATKTPHAVSFKTGPFPGFPTDLQAPMMAAQCIAQGRSVIEETVFENRLMQVRELQKMGAQIHVTHNHQAIITGVDELFGASVIAPDIRSSCALVLAGLVARGTTTMTGIKHWLRGYESLELKLASIGAPVRLVLIPEDIVRHEHTASLMHYEHTSLTR